MECNATRAKNKRQPKVKSENTKNENKIVHKKKERVKETECAKQKRVK